MTRVTCPKCDERFRIPEPSSAPTVRCPSCRHRFALPEEEYDDDLVFESDSEPEDKPLVNVTAEKPEPAPRPRGDRPRRRRKKPAATGFQLARWHVIAGASALGLATLVVVVGGLWLVLGRRGKPADGPGGGGGNAAAPAGDFVTVASSTVQPDAAKRVAAVRPSPLEPAAADDSPLPPLPKLPAFVPPTATTNAVGLRLPADPSKDKPHDWANNLLLPHPGIYVASVSQQAVPPLLSSLGGRFAAVANEIDSSYRLIEAADAKVPGRFYITPNHVPKTPPPVTLLDTSTGGKVGTYAWNVPLMTEARLAPDGGYLVTPAAVSPQAAETCLLDVWKKNADAPAGQLKVAGKVRWTEFVSPTRLAMLVFAPEPTVQVWDVVERKLLHSLPVKAALPKILTAKNGIWFAPPDHVSYWRVRAAATVSPGGRYVAVGAASAVVIFDVQEAKEVGRLPFTTAGELISYETLGFLPENNQLAAILHPSELHVWDLNAGRELYRNVVQRPPGGFAVLAGDLYPGPMPDTLLVAGLSPQIKGGVSTLIDARTGNLLHSLAYALAGPPVNGRALAFGPRSAATKPEADATKERRRREDTSNVTFTAALDAAALVKDATPMRKATEARPAVTFGDRAGVVVREPTPPAKWVQPFPGSWSRPSAEPTLLPEWPNAFADSVGAVLRYVPQPKPLPRNEIVCDRYDLATGKRVGEPVTLWPWTLNPFVDPEVKRTGVAGSAPAMPPAALTADGERLAFVDPGERHRIDVWNAKGERQLGFYAAPPGQAIDWVGWSADGKLLTVAGGLLTAWDAKAARAVFAVHGGYESKCELAPGRKWGVFAARGRIDLIDLSDGRCLGRCRAKGLPTYCEAVRLSPDAARLLAVGKGGQAGGKYVYTGWVWDLSNGSAEQCGWTNPKEFFRDLHWAGWISPDQFVLCNDVPAVFDLKAKGQVTGLESFARRGLHDKAPWFATSPDGRLWVHWRVTAPTPDCPGPWGWQPLGLPDTAAALADPERQFADLTNDPIAVEFDLGDRARSQEAAQKVADGLAGQGYKVGGGGWRLRLSHRQSEGATTLTSSMGREVKLAGVTFDWELLSPAGHKAWGQRTTQGMLGRGSKYYKGTKAGSGFVGPGIPAQVDNYEFGLNPQAAVTEEILEYVARQVQPPKLPTWFVSSGGSATQLPAPGKWVAR